MLFYNLFQSYFSFLDINECQVMNISGNKQKFISPSLSNGLINEVRSGNDSSIFTFILIRFEKEQEASFNVKDMFMEKKKEVIEYWKLTVTVTQSSISYIDKVDLDDSKNYSGSNSLLPLDLFIIVISTG